MDLVKDREPDRRLEAIEREIAAEAEGVRDYLEAHDAFALADGFFQAVGGHTPQRMRERDRAEGARGEARDRMASLEADAEEGLDRIKYLVRLWERIADREWNPTAPDN